MWFIAVCHAEMNAILNKNCSDVRGCRLYTALFPCNECAKIIIQSRIAEVIYASGKNMGTKEGQASIRMFDAAGVKYRYCQSSQSFLTFLFLFFDIHYFFQTIYPKTLADCH